MTITSEERELLDMLHKATPERKKPYADYADCWGTSGRDYRV